MILSSFLLFAKFAWAGTVLAPFGAIEDLVVKKNPWHGFDANGPVLTVVRVQSDQLLDSRTCQDWTTDHSTQYGHLVGFKKETLFGAWEPWTKKDIDAVNDCDDFPCDVKLNSKETQVLAKSSIADRKSKYFEVVRSRIDHYLKTERRGEYEFPGNPVDPWALLRKEGFASKLSLPGMPSLYERKLDFGQDSFRPLRQILDIRFSKSAAGNLFESVSWLRDIYTDHYFDSWGEWTWVQCDLNSKKVTVVQALLVEMDLLKKTDLLSRLGRGRMRSAVEKFGNQYLHDRYLKISGPALLEFSK